MLQRNPEVLEQELDGEILLLLNGSTDVLHLNATAGALWQALDRPRSLAEVAQELAEAYAAPLDQVTADLVPLVAALVERRALLST